MPLEVIGAGFGRTGTMSLQVALDQIGPGPCYHMREVRENPGHVAMWREATATGATDWDVLFARYRSAVDWPASRFWEPLASHYPDARVILTVRDPERWYQSVQQTIYQVMMSPSRGSASGAADPLGTEQRQMARELIVDGVFQGRFEDRDFTIGVFEANVAAVKASIPPERLLLFEVAEGWEPLCAFLDLPVPSQPFPRINSTEEFRARFTPE